MKSARVGIGLILVIASCGKRETSLPGAGTMVRASDDASVFALNVDEGSITWWDPDHRRASTVHVGREPTRIARAGDRLFVTLRADDAVAVLHETGDGAQLESTFAVGAEPYGVVATRDGSRVYVAISLEDRVVEYDGVTLAPLRSWTVLDEPRWLALTPSEQVLFVASLRNGHFTRIDLESGEQSDVTMPNVQQGEGPGKDSGIPDFDPEFAPVGLDVRLTADPIVTLDGLTLAVPAFYVDNHTPVVSPEDGGGESGGYSAGDAAIPGRMNPALVLFDLDPLGYISGEGRAVFLAVDGGRAAWRSYPSAVLPSDDSRYFAVAMEGSSAVVVVDSEPYDGVKSPNLGRNLFGDGPEAFGMYERPATPIHTVQGPRGLAFVKGDLLVHGFLSRSVETLDWGDAVEANQFQAHDKEGRAVTYLGHGVDRSGPLVESALPPNVAHGRELFWSADDRTITSTKGGVSCATCHFDGRNDGLTWTFGTRDDSQPTGFALSELQTPSLAGGVALTAPLTWSGDVASVADEARETSVNRMGGRGLSTADLADISAFVEWDRLPDLPAQDPTLVAEGQALFERPDVACSTCHSGPRFTDNQNHEVFGGSSVQTPSLTRIAATAPYLHDGSAENLRAVLAFAATGAMGDTSMLSPHDLDALEAYLRSL